MSPEHNDKSFYTLIIEDNFDISSYFRMALHNFLLQFGNQVS